MANGINGSFRCGIDGRDVNIHGVIPAFRTLREVPLRGAGGRSQARFGRPHDTAIRAPGCDIAPTFARKFNEVPCAVIDYQAGERLRWKA